MNQRLIEHPSQRKVGEGGGKGGSRKRAVKFVSKGEVGEREGKGREGARIFVTEGEVSERGREGRDFVIEIICK